MITRHPVLLPTADGGWELWAATRLHCVDDPGDLNGQALHFGLPLDYCRSFPLFLPSKDKKLFRDLIYAQLERRHLVSPTSNARFSFEPLERSSEGTLVRVDFVNRDLPATWEAKKSVSYGPALRYYPLPADAVVVLREHGRLVMLVSRGPKLLYSCILSQKAELGENVASEVQTALLSLKARSYLKEDVRSLELWGEFPPDAVEKLRDALGFDITRRDPPTPEVGRHPPQGALLKSSADFGGPKRRQLLTLSAAGLVVLIGYLAVIKQFRDKLSGIEAEIAAQEENLGENSASSATHAAARERWKAMANAVDPLRYPLVQLNTISQVMPPDGVILSSFETKISEAKLNGKANSAKAVFDFLENLNAEPQLGQVYRWSRKKEPSLDDDGTAHFELIGKLK